MAYMLFFLIQEERIARCINFFFTVLVVFVELCLCRLPGDEWLY